MWREESAMLVTVQHGTNRLRKQDRKHDTKQDRKHDRKQSPPCVAGTGLDFSAASAVVFVELPQEVALVRQAEDRAHRHGQRRSVNVYFLVARGTSDERRSALPALPCPLVWVPCMAFFFSDPGHMSCCGCGSEASCERSLGLSVQLLVTAKHSWGVRNCTVLYSVWLSVW